MSFAVIFGKQGYVYHIGRFNLGWNSLSSCYTGLTVLGKGIGKGRVGTVKLLLLLSCHHDGCAGPNFGAGRQLASVLWGTAMLVFWIVFWPSAM